MTGDGMRQEESFVYIMTNADRGVLYVGVTADLPARVSQHRRGEGSAFCRRYNLTRLVWWRSGASIEGAIELEKRLKRWRRAWKIALIEEMNPHWRDLFEELL